jgi:hypothetical protein
MSKAQLGRLRCAPSNNAWKYTSRIKLGCDFTKKTPVRYPIVSYDTPMEPNYLDITRLPELKSVNSSVVYL